MDPGQYYLRNVTYTKKGETRPKTGNQSCVFRPSGGHKLVKKSEFEHLHNGPPVREKSETRKNFLTRSTAELF